MYLRFSKIRQEAIAPCRSHSTDAGLDFFIPNDFNRGEKMIIPPHGSVMIATGLRIEIPVGFMGLFCNKSGVASKKNLVLGAHIIDTFYEGEVIINLHNIANTSVEIMPGEKIAQLVLVPIVCSGVVEVDSSELYKDFRINEYRGEKGFGASDKK